MRESPRRLGRYYTPDDVAQVLVEWALAGGAGPLLDPSYGGCSFLHAGLQHLERLANGGAPGYVYGVDVDPEAMIHARSLFNRGVPTGNLRTANFLRGAGGFDVQFRCIVGNPPFIRHHCLDSDSIGIARGLAEAQGCFLPRTANSWAYFVAMSTRHLAPSGRMALLVPVGGLEADFAAPLLDFLGANFRELLLLPVEETLFEGTRERVAALLASGWGEGPGRVVHGATVSRLELRVAVLGGADQRLSTINNDWSLLKRTESMVGWSELGKIARVEIGTVTGANGFFIRRPSELDGRACNSELIVATSRRLGGLVWSSDDADALENADAACRLLDLPGTGLDTLNLYARRLIEEGEEARLQDRFHCRKRDHWWSIPDRSRPDAFLHYMSSRAPRIVLNDGGSLCTNAIHRVNWTSANVDASAVAASSCTTLFELACELRSRSYGGGVLKLEPSAAKLLPVATTGPSPIDELDKALRAGRADVARETADRAILLPAGIKGEQIALMREAVDRLRRQRRRRNSG